MSESIEGLQRQIASATDLQSVVRTMKAIAAASIGQYEQSVRALADYDRAVALGLGACLRALGPAGRRGRPGRRGGAPVVNAIVFGSDQGLVGRFNEVVAERAIAALARRARAPRVWAVGERVHARLADAGLAPTACLAVPTSVKRVAPLVGRILVDGQRRGWLDADAELRLFHNRPSTGAAYECVEQRLLPLDDDWRRARAALAWPTKHLPEVAGGGVATLAALVGEHVFVSLFRACAESLASENASRLAAMDRADRNIDELVDGLRGRFHRLRQDGIDEELFDVVAGFEALVGDRSRAGPAP